MANAKDIFNSAKLNIQTLTSSNASYNSIGEITESVKLQNRFISNVDYSLPENFAKFGSAEEYYKNAITYISKNYPYDAPKKEKNKWINNLNELEYSILENEYPKYAGYLFLTKSQHISVYSPTRNIENDDIKNVYQNADKYFVQETLDTNKGFTFESWLRFDSGSSTERIFSIWAIESASSGLTSSCYMNIYRSSSYIQLKPGIIEGSVFPNSPFNSYIVPTSSWHHYAVSINKNSSSLYVDGELKQKITLTLPTTSSYAFLKVGLLPTSLTSSVISTASFSVQPIFRIGSGSHSAPASNIGSTFNIDETRFWNKERTPEQIGRNWFTQVDGNEFDDEQNRSLIFYYKYNEGWDTGSYGDICLDYSGYKNNGLIVGYNTSSRSSGSAINLAGLVQDTETGNPIYAPSLSYSSGGLQDFYNTKTSEGKDYDVTNIHALYKKFPSWILEQEDEQEIKHLKQIIQVVCSYFDDLYNKITEISDYKHVKFNTENQNLYPFYDKILTSAGFDVTDLFNNLSFLEKISSRTEKNIFDEDIAKIKNSILQNIYNNLSYILKSKGTEKSLKSFLRSYGINEDLVRINLYADKARYTISDKYKETVVKKKTLTLTGSQNIFLSGTSFSMPEEYTFESSIIFPKALNNTSLTSSIMGLFISDPATTYLTSSSKLKTIATVESSSYGHILCLRTGSDYALVASSSVIKDLYDDTVWNLAISMIPNVDDIETAQNYNYKLIFRATNNYRGEKQFFSGSVVSSASYLDALYAGNTRYFLGAEKISLTGSTIYNSNAKYLYSNFWTKYITDDELTSHNRDILNYGVE